MWKLVHMTPGMREEDKRLVSVALEEAFYVSIDTMLPTGISTGCKEGDIEKVKAWLGNGGSINAEDPHGETLLHVGCSVAEIKHVEIVEVLIRRGADVNQKQGYTGGRTPLMAVAESGGSCGAEIALRLMAAGAHKEETSTDDKQTAVDLATKQIGKIQNQPGKLAKEEIEEAVGRFKGVIDAINNWDAAPGIKEAERRAKQEVAEESVFERRAREEEAEKKKEGLPVRAHAAGDRLWWRSEDVNQ